MYKRTAKSRSKGCRAAAATMIRIKSGIGYLDQPTSASNNEYDNLTDSIDSQFRHLRQSGRNSSESSMESPLQTKGNNRLGLGYTKHTLVQLAPVDSKNPALAAIARRYQGLDFDGAKPKLLFVDPKVLTTTAAYDVETHTIKADKSTKDEVKLWDNILFEAQNARNQAKFKAASKSKGKGSKKTFSEYGEEYAAIEFDSFMKYYRELLEVEKEISDRKKLPKQAQKALAKGDEYVKLSETEACKKFISSAHKSGTTGKAGLSSTDLYAYESVEDSDLKTVSSRLTNVARPIFKKMGGLTGNTAQALRSSYGSFSWPPEQAKRPHALHLLLAGAIKKASELKSVNPGKVKYLDDFISIVETMKLSDKAQKVAKLAFTNPS